MSAHARLYQIAETKIIKRSFLLLPISSQLAGTLTGSRKYIPVQGAKYSFAGSIGRRWSSEDILESNDVEDHFLTRRRHSDHWYIAPGQINSYFHGP